MLVANALRGAVQVARTGVVAETGPKMQHFVDGRSGETWQVREACHEALEIRHDRTHLGLLQHDFADPDAVGTAIALPRQIVTPRTRLPSDEQRSDGRGVRGIHVPAVYRRTHRAVRSAASAMRGGGLPRLIC